MPNINVSLKDGADDKQLDAAKKMVTDQGGQIKREYTAVKGFTAEMPADKVSAMKSNQHIDVEHDGQMKTQ